MRLFNADQPHIHGCQKSILKWLETASKKTSQWLETASGNRWSIPYKSRQSLIKQLHTRNNNNHRRFPTTRKIRTNGELTSWIEMKDLKQRIISQVFICSIFSLEWPVFGKKLVLTDRHTWSSLEWPIFGKELVLIDRHTWSVQCAYQ